MSTLDSSPDWDLIRFWFRLGLSVRSVVGRAIAKLYWNTLKMQHLIQCQFLPEDQIIPVIDNEMDKSN